MPDAPIGTADVLPALPLEAWEDTKETLHRFTQIVGKIRLAFAPPRNHWWHVPLYVTSRGLTTSLMPHGDVRFAIDFDFITHQLVIRTHTGAIEQFDLVNGLSVAQFHEHVRACLARLGIHVRIWARPYSLTDDTPFALDTGHHSYDRTYVERWWRILAQIAPIFEAFAGRFSGKTSPVHLFWHSFDLALTRFSGRRAPEQPGIDPVNRAAYSHEVISFGFWAGDARIRAPAFYSYTAPEPPDLTGQQLRPESATWSDTGNGSLALLWYEDVRRFPGPRAGLLDFLESTYLAGARTAGWDMEAFAASPTD